MEIELRFRGISSHGSAPERGKNAVYMAARAALAIEKLHPELRSDDFLGKGSVAVTEFVSGSPSLCAVADYAKLHLDRRLTWNEDEDSALREIEKALEGEEFEISVPEYKGVAYTGKEYGMKKYFPTWKLEENHPVIESGAKVYEELFSQKPLIDKWTFSTNGVTINGLFTIPIIGFGPGNEVLAHAPNEKVPVGQLTTAAAFYAAYALQF
jgi:putative selenium metabolism hydrolase